jgi:hypothetical protein
MKKGKHDRRLETIEEELKQQYKARASIVEELKQ